MGQAIEVIGETVREVISETVDRNTFRTDTTKCARSPTAGITSVKQKHEN